MEEAGLFSSFHRDGWRFLLKLYCYVLLYNVRFHKHDAQLMGKTCSSNFARTF